MYRVRGTKLLATRSILFTIPGTMIDFFL